MAAVVRKRDSRRVSYAKLRERLADSALPWDDEAERGAIGAVLLAPNIHARKMVKRAFSGHFFDRGHGWLWEQISQALTKNILTDRERSIASWLRAADIAARFRRQFFGRAGNEIAACLKTGFWWHGNYFIDRVLLAAKTRAGVVNAAEQLGKALDAADLWRAGQ